MNALLCLGRLLDLHRIEVAGDDGLGVLVGGADDPQNEEEGHHRSHEVGERDFPRPAMMLVLERAAASDDDDLRVIDAHRLRSEIQRGEKVRPWTQLSDDLASVGLDDDFNAVVLDVADIGRQGGDAIFQEPQNPLRTANGYEAG